jgi:hypothetical protein
MSPYLVLALGYTAAATAAGWCWWKGGPWRQASLAAGVVATQAFYGVFALSADGWACVPCGWLVGLVLASLPAWLLSIPMDAVQGRLLRRADPQARSHIGRWTLTVVVAQTAPLGYHVGKPVAATMLILTAVGAWAWCRVRREGGLLDGRDEAMMRVVLALAPLLGPTQMLMNGKTPAWCEALTGAVGMPVTFTLWLPITLAALYGTSQVAQHVDKRDRSIVVAACVPLIYISFSMPLLALAGATKYAVFALILSFVQAAAHVLIAVARQH